MKSKLPLCGTMISLPVSHRRKDKAPFGGAAPLPGRGDAARNRCARKDARPWPFCNAPYARVLRAFSRLVQWVAAGAVSFTGPGWRHTGSIAIEPLLANPLGFLVFPACATADSGIS